MRNAFAEEITRLGREDPRVVLLSGDIGNKLFDKFREHSPERFFNCGVAEANMMGVAAGLALNGLRPVVYTITPFTTTRCFEQIRVDVCYHDAPVVIVGTGAGLSYAELGPTHHSLEDIAILRTLPGMTVLAPCDALELRALLRAALQGSGPVYMRIGKKGEPAIHERPPEVTIGRAITVRPGRTVALLSTGNIMPVVLEAARALEGEGLSPRVESFHTVKPLDEERLAEIFPAFDLVATVEEHGRVGGLGGSVAEWRAAHDGQGARLLSLGTDDAFLHQIGSQDYARHHFGLHARNIADRVLAALGRR
jgi:transketolase